MRTVTQDTQMSHPPVRYYTCHQIERIKVSKRTLFLTLFFLSMRFQKYIIKIYASHFTQKDIEGMMMMMMMMI